ncbi:MAG: DNA mismatch repair protein MutS [Polyangiaceae bacterium]|nr:DNA mismatch repair protein MutS [Polyangiaceae bacterium]
MAAGKKQTPVMRQYEEAKAEFPDAILFFRLGDFYEMFHTDAVLVARELGLTLTSRNKNAADEIPMAGVPYHAAAGYVAKLLARGHKVAICEQLADPSKCKGIVPRKVVRVVTPSLTTDESQLDARRNNHLVAIDAGVDAGGLPRGPFGVATLDLSTGELAAGELPAATLLLAQIARADPSELLLAEASAAALGALVAGVAPRAAVRTDAALEAAEVRAVLDRAPETPLAAEAELQHGEPALRAAARALRFAERHLPGTRLPVRRVRSLDAESAMHIDDTAQRHLELVRGADGGPEGALLGAIDFSVTAGGARLLRRRLLAPLCDVGAIRRRLDAVELLVAHARAREELRRALGRVGDLERLAVRAALGEASPRDLGGLRDSLGAVPDVRAAVATIPEPGAVALLEAGELDDPRARALAELLLCALVPTPPPRASDGDIVCTGYAPELDTLRRLRQDGEKLMSELEARLRAEAGIATLKVRFTRVFGWYIEVTKTHLGKVPPGWRRKQTVAGAERYGCAELDELAESLGTAEERCAELEARLFRELVAAAAAASEPALRLGATIARLDVAAALAELAHRHDYARPEVDDGPRLELGGARHPVVERSVPFGAFVPNDTALDLEGERLLLVTGPNMAGKSTLMRQVALCCVLAQMGSFVPARSARVGIVDRLLSRVGASDNLAAGESTFMVEMRETTAILRDATPRSLVILDEIGRGTSTFDGLAIAWAVTEYLDEVVRCRALFATHYHELTDIARERPQIANYSVSAREHAGGIVFLHRLARGAASKSYGVAVAKLAGLPDVVVRRARAILAELERGGRAPAHATTAVAGGDRQLDLFASAGERAEREVCAELRAIDPEHTTPLEALALLARLRSALGS